MLAWLLVPVLALAAAWSGLFVLHLSTPRITKADVIRIELDGLQTGLVGYDAAYDRELRTCGSEALARISLREGTAAWREPSCWEEVLWGEWLPLYGSYWIEDGVPHALADLDGDGRPVHYVPEPLSPSTP